MRPPQVAVLVNSTDSYHDCWEPLFSLFANFWPDCPYPVVLNTETREYEHSAVSIRVVHASPRPDGRRPTWSECLIDCLDGLGTPFVLYLQEDYFLNRPVDGALIARLVERMDCEQLDHVRLIDFGDERPGDPLGGEPPLSLLAPRSNYLVSLQAGIWRTEHLRSLLREPESPWQFERWGTLRARRSGVRYARLDQERYPPERSPISYVATGIVAGRWYEPAVVPLFEEHGLVVDFGRRGYHRPGAVQRLRAQVRRHGRRWMMRVVP